MTARLGHVADSEMVTDWWVGRRQAAEAACQRAPSVGRRR